jgi:TIGR00268 family protein
MDEKELKLKELLKEIGKIVITYSGGIDSSYLLKVALDTLGSENVLAAVVNSELFPDYEFDMAIDLANEMGARVIGLEMEELSDPRIAANTPKIWYYSKKLLYQTIKQHVEQEGFTVLSDGTIMDDVDDFRPGVKARNEEGVRSLLQEAGLYKNEIRQLAKRLGVENWNKVPSCSMASRFPYGTKITAEKVRWVQEAEAYLIQLGFEQVRVRVHQDLARIEVSLDLVPTLLDHRQEIESKLRSIGFSYVALDLAGYQYGRMNQVLTEKEKAKIG